MQYEDETRHYTFLSGFLVGALLGTGLALLARPARGRLLAHRGQRSSRGWRRRGRGWLGRSSDGMFESLLDILGSGRKRLNL